jgi:hypothetical protein
MKNFLKKFIAGFILLLLTTEISFAQVNNPNYFKKVGNAINFTSESWTFGSAINPIDDIYVDNLTAGSLSFPSLGDTVFDGKVTIDDTDVEALLVRKNADAGDVFTVDTNTSTVTATGDLKGTGRVAFGNTSSFGVATVDKIWDFSHTVTDFSSNASWDAMRGRFIINPSIDLTGASATYISGFDLSASVQSGNVRNIEAVTGVYNGAFHSGTGTVASLLGSTAVAQVLGSGNATVSIGQFVISEHSGTGSLGSNYGGYFQSGHSGSGGSISTLDHTIHVATPSHTRTIASHVGLFLEDQAFGTTNWSIYSANGNVEFSAITGDTADLQMSGADITHGLTTLAPTNTFLYFQPVSGTAGGAQISGFSDTDAVGIVMKGIMGSSNPTDATAAVKVIGAKSNGTTGVSDLGAAETVYEISNNATSLVTVLGNGTVTAPFFSGNGAALTALNGSNVSTGTVAIARGGTGQGTAAAGFDALAPTTTRGDIIVRGASSNGRVALGAKGRSLTSNGTDTVFSAPRKFNFNAFGGWSAIAANIGAWGSLGNAVTTGTLTAGNSVDGAFVDYATAATTDADAGVASASSIRLLDNKFFGWVAFQMQTTATVRTFCGFTSTSAIATTLGADDVAGQRMAGLQFSTNRGDTNFQFMTDDNTTQTLTSTGIAVDTNMHFLMIDGTAGNSIVYTLYNSAGVVQATSTQSTNLPVATSAFSLTCGNRTLANSAADIRVFKAYVESELIQ